MRVLHYEKQKQTTKKKTDEKLTILFFETIGKVGFCHIIEPSSSPWEIFTKQKINKYRDIFICNGVVHGLTCDGLLVSVY